MNKIYENVTGCVELINSPASTEKLLTELCGKLSGNELKTVAKDYLTGNLSRESICLHLAAKRVEEKYSKN